jgi:predicted outer membrane repeat protein
VVASAAGSSPASFALTNTGPAFASLVVNTTSDSLFPGPGLLSLREAIAFANLDSSGTSSITFDPAIFATLQTITLTGTQLELSNGGEAETITGPSVGLTVSGGGLSRVFQVDPGVTASISALTITGGSADRGAGLDANEGSTIVLNDCTISGNSAGVVGGGLDSYAAATLTNCTFSGNSAGLSGGGLQSTDGTVTIFGCTISGNSSRYGGGMNNNGPATLTDCTISGNSAAQSGGLRGSFYGTSVSSFTITSCTITGNSAAYSGGGLLSEAGTVTLSNTIVAGNTAGTAPDVSGGMTSQGNNLIGETDGSSGWVGSDLTGTITKPLNPALAPLGNFGGPTQTIPLLPGSPAIDAGGNGAGIPATDQRGESRVGGVDIGAFESQGFQFAIVPGSTPQAADIGTAFANPLAVAVTANNAVEPVDGGVVIFVANPAANGATAIFLDSSVVIAGGQAALTAAPNNVDGSYNVVASASSLSASFDLTNAGSAFAALVVNMTSDSIA